MREVTLNQLRLLIDDIAEDLKNKKNELYSNSVKIIHKDSNSHEELMSLNYDFETNFKIVEDLTEKLITYKSLLQQANFTTKVNEEDTIVTALIKLKEKRQFVKTLESLSFKEEQKRRKIDSSYSNSYYIEHVKLNFNKQELLEKKELLRNEINELEAQLNDANSVTKIAIPK